MQATRNILPGFALSALVAIAAVAVAPLVARIVPIPAMVIALFIGIALNPVARRPLFQPGIVFCLKMLLRWAVALLGLRVALGEIAALGFATAALVVIAMAITIACGIPVRTLVRAERRLRRARRRRHRGLRRLRDARDLDRGAGLQRQGSRRRFRGGRRQCAVDGGDGALSADLHRRSDSTPQRTGVMLGATIHDVAQVVGAGYAVSEPVGNTAVVVKLFRVFLLFPVVLSIGWFFARRAVTADAAKIPFPMFALVFVLLCVLNSIAPVDPGDCAGLSR